MDEIYHLSKWAISILKIVVGACTPCAPLVALVLRTDSVSNTLLYIKIRLYIKIFSVSFICLFCRTWNRKRPKITKNTTFKNGSFKSCLCERVCENMIYSSCCFLRNSSGFICCWNYTISVDKIKKFLHFLTFITVK